MQIHIIIAPTCFGFRPSSGSLYTAWLKLTSVKTFSNITSLYMRGDVAACREMACVLFVVQTDTLTEV